MGDLIKAMFKVECKLKKFTINIMNQHYSCQEWDLIDIHYVHPISIMGWKNVRLNDFVHESLRNEAWANAYKSLN